MIKENPDYESGFLIYLISFWGVLNLLNTTFCFTGNTYKLFPFWKRTVVPLMMRLLLLVLEKLNPLLKRKPFCKLSGLFFKLREVMTDFAFFFLPPPVVKLADEAE